MLAEAADILSDQLRTLLRRLGVSLRPECDRLDACYLDRLRRLGFDLRERRALAALTVGAAARFLGKGRAPADFFEQVEYNGRRLAKLNLSPSAIVSALAEYDRVLEPVLRRRLPAEHGNFQWVREQLQFCVLLTLNNAYYHVRETETQAFYEMFWAELQARNLEDLLGRFLAILARFSKADEARLYLLDANGALCRQAAFGTGSAASGEGMALSQPLRRMLERPRQDRPAGAKWVIEDAWRKGGRAAFASCWSIPMLSGASASGGRLAGVMQFAFRREYDWLPREQDLLTAASERCMMAAEKAKLLEDLAAQERQIRRLAENLMHVEEAERRRISHELHDQTGQDLLWIRLQMEMMERDLPAGDEAWRPRLAEVRDMTERTIIEIRRLIAALSPAVLEQLGLAPALRQMVNRFRMAHPARVNLQIGELEPLSKQLETVAYRLVQECLNNVAKHSSCKVVNISVRTDDGHLCLVVDDDGNGFCVEERLSNPGTFGLSGIRERVALLGGQCRIESRTAQARNAGSTPGRSTGARAKRGKDRKSTGRASSEGLRTRAGKARTGTTVAVTLPIAQCPDQAAMPPELAPAVVQSRFAPSELTVAAGPGGRPGGFRGAIGR